jgi:hypothetical protein
MPEHMLGGLRNKQEKGSCLVVIENAPKHGKIPLFYAKKHVFSSIKGEMCGRVLTDSAPNLIPRYKPPIMKLSAF